VCQACARAYLFLRDVEHAIQAWEDRQTQELPVDETAAPGAGAQHGVCGLGGVCGSPGRRTVRAWRNISPS
jgi:hypothetical protein